ncbi:hypothetical protein JL721_2573 [Aureococcus anophagefferens]|nr:hypothetical protein JL721_2573 [Aureococcus anophagefferens]
MSSARTGCVVLAGGRGALAGARQERVVGCARKPCGGQESPGFEGDMAAFVEANPAARYQCENRVKKCVECGKVCAVSIAACNGCGAPLTNVAESTTHNVFSGFCFGVAKGPFPFKLSLRYESEDCLVFDDPLCIAPCHVCAIPTDRYVPTATSLFRAPAAGAAILRRLEDRAWAAVETQFLADEPWVAKIYGRQKPAPGALRTAAIAGFNVPPSQFQLHLQYMGEAFDDADGFDGPTLIERVAAATGVDYDAAWTAAYGAVQESQDARASWDPTDFRYVVGDASGAVDSTISESGVVADFKLTEGVERPHACDLSLRDKMALANYDRDGVYSRFPKAAPLPTIVDP